MSEFCVRDGMDVEPSQKDFCFPYATEGLMMVKKGRKENVSAYWL
jgi:hypothetical protein